MLDDFDNYDDDEDFVSDFNYTGKPGLTFHTLL